MNRWFHFALMNTLVPVRLRLMRKIRAQQGWRQDQIREYQELKLRKLIQHCWRYVPYYRSKWSPYISSPAEIQTIEDLQRLPVLTKDELRDNLDTLTTTAPFVRSQPARSGGSTGRPTLFRVTHYDQELSWAQMYTGWTWAGYRVGDPFQAVGGESIGVGLTDKRIWKDFVMHRWITSGSNLTLERTKILAAAPHFNKIQLIYGYPNSIRELCELLKIIGARPPNLRGVVCTAEVMRPEVREEISSYLGVPVHDQYGLNDGGLFAMEGPERNGLHVFFHRAVLEIVNEHDQQIWELGSPGRAIGTCLTNLATPFVRYDTGDEVHWLTHEPAPSGIAWPRIGPVDGRTGDVIYLPSGRRIPMPGLTLVMRWIDGLYQYQFIQTGPRTVTVRMERGPHFKMTEAEVVTYLRERIADEVEWTVAWGKPELTQNSKLLVIRNDWLRAQGLKRPPRTPADQGLVP